MRILVIGAGGVGGFFGGLLAKAGADVTFIARGKHLEAIQKHGITVNSGGTHFSVAVKASANPLELSGPFDYLLHCTKTWDITETTRTTKHLVGRDSAVVITQNGVDAQELAAAELPAGSLVGGSVQIVSAIASPGVIQHSSAVKKFTIGEFDRRMSPRVERLFQICKEAGIDAAVSEDINAEIWSKLLFISSFGGVTSLARSPIGPILASPPLAGIYERCMREVFEVAKGMGVNLPLDAVKNKMEFSRGLEPNLTSSMLRDLNSGSRLELNSLNGAVSRFGKKLGIDTPVNDTIFAALSPYIGGK